MTLKIYYAAAIDNCPDKGRTQLEQFKQLLKKYPIELRGAGIGDSPIIKLDSSPCVKGVIAAHDLKELRECDILLVVLDSKAQAIATFMELEYARQLGLYIVVLILSKTTEKCPYCDRQKMIAEGNKSIFLETWANMIIYSIEELEVILNEITNVADED